MMQPTNRRATAHTPAGTINKIHNFPAVTYAVPDGDMLANAIQCELRHEPITAALAIEVEVWDRVAHLRGVVSGPTEAEAAVSVAARVDGVGLVADDLLLRRAGLTLVHIGEEERMLLVRLLRRAIRDVRYELSVTQTDDVRELIKPREALLTGLLERVQTAANVSRNQSDEVATAKAGRSTTHLQLRGELTSARRSRA